MNRVGLGLAVGAGYVLGRTKKMKLAFALGTLAAGKRMHLSPRALTDLVSQQLQNNPQLKEISDQLREGARGAGKAATGAMLERQIDGLAERLHGRTTQLREHLSEVTPDVPGADAEEDRDETAEDEEEPRERANRDERDTDEEREEEPEEEHEEEHEKKPSARKGAARQGTARKAGAGARKPAKTPAAKKAPAKKPAAKKTAGRRTTAQKAPAKGTAAAQAAPRKATRESGRERRRGR
ncbi:DNA primase [Streptomyces bluensis]|uniref:DNA primase n=1 Tax=Streptomyces bluensis TaxID=33897 RepID=A0ABW6UL60_9ACTN